MYYFYVYVFDIKGATRTFKHRRHKFVAVRIYHKRDFLNRNKFSEIQIFLRFFWFFVKILSVYRNFKYTVYLLDDNLECFNAKNFHDENHTFAVNGQISRNVYRNREKRNENAKTQ